MIDLRLGGALGFWILDALTKSFGAAPWTDNNPEFMGTTQSKLERFFGPEIWERLKGRTVLDFGAGRGIDAVDAAAHGSAAVYGAEVLASYRETADALAQRYGVADRCTFFDPLADHATVERLAGTLDVVYTLDSFEHFADPEAMLEEMYRLLRPGGVLLISFGPLWLHPYGPHLMHFNRLPWLHFLFREKTIIDVRETYIHDGARRFEDIASGLNRMTVGRFTGMIERSKFDVARLKLMPIRGLDAFVRNRLTREYFTSVIVCELCKSVEVAAPIAQLR
jgi:SAM-dependent methyltransferase